MEMRQTQINFTRQAIILNTNLIYRRLFATYYCTITHLIIYLLDDKNHKTFFCNNFYISIHQKSFANLNQRRQSYPCSQYSARNGDVLFCERVHWRVSIFSIIRCRRGTIRGDNRADALCLITIRMDRKESEGQHGCLCTPAKHWPLLLR